MINTRLRNNYLRQTRGGIRTSIQIFRLASMLTALGPDTRRCAVSSDLGQELLTDESRRRQPACGCILYQQVVHPVKGTNGLDKAWLHKEPSLLGSTSKPSILVISCQTGCEELAPALSVRPKLACSPWLKWKCIKGRTWSHWNSNQRSIRVRLLQDVMILRPLVCVHPF